MNVHLGFSEFSERHIPIMYCVCHLFGMVLCIYLQVNKFKMASKLFLLLFFRYGRKPVLFPSVAVIIISGFVSGFVQNFWLFFLLRCVIGFAQGGVALTIFVLASELVGPRYRALSGTLIWFAFTLALCLVGFQAWLVPDWRKLELIMSAPYAFVVIFWK